MASAREVLSPEIPARLLRGWEIGRENFGRRVSFFAPSLKRFTTSEFRQRCDCSFAPLSITGSSCQLMCDHCRGDILGWMQPAVTPRALVEAAARLYKRGAHGILVSGGSDHSGVVPLAGFLDAISEVKYRFGLKVIVHTGLTGRPLAEGLARAGVDAALIDVIGSAGTIGEVCHLRGVTPTDYGRSLLNLCEAGVPVSPHVVIGLDRGAIDGELQALETISRYPVASLVLVGLLPLKETPMAGVTPPSPDDMAGIFLAARELLPRTEILLGCQRPAGEHRLLTDALALKSGLNGIAYPAEGVIGLAGRMGLEPGFSESCCALAPAIGNGSASHVIPGGETAR